MDRTREQTSIVVFLNMTAKVEIRLGSATILWLFQSHSVVSGKRLHTGPDNNSKNKEVLWRKRDLEADINSHSSA